MGREGKMMEGKGERKGSGEENPSLPIKIVRGPLLNRQKDGKYKNCFNFFYL